VKASHSWRNLFEAFVLPSLRGPLGVSGTAFIGCGAHWASRRDSWTVAWMLHFLGSANLAAGAPINGAHLTMIATVYRSHVSLKFSFAEKIARRRPHCEKRSEITGTLDKSPPIQPHAVVGDETSILRVDGSSHEWRPDRSGT
jgi:hypothetical protein